MKLEEVVIRLTLAIIIGGAIGYEREFRNRPAGFRTHILVCVGATVISMIQLYDLQYTINLIKANPELATSIKADVGRLDAQVISGIGFLGAGTIIRDNGSVKGLTTAASLWTVACIGLAIGMGYYALSILSSIAVVISLVTLKRFESKFLDKNKLVQLELEYLEKNNMIQKITEYFHRRNIKIKNIEFIFDTIEKDEENVYEKSLFTIVVPKYINYSQILKDLSSFDGIIKVSIL
ncbi:putative Mg(2+) transport ATPase [Clostridium liquoris]|jgi:putative Mg2+ transporter-C (MgtC) family protein|uniref:Putative Mg(2+) transport ATPase n=1 Tax=Clostridium liquoris TaxID=1289519 RepID=A0A2T0B452_9CLOT|nr:MgtC/SapB family protein [Clostridium liquoris]PRR78669.1 putative Mg(2+) transport ATPase [Clostridium liquoris]